MTKKSPLHKKNEAPEIIISPDAIRNDSTFHNIRIACLRWKQLNNGAVPRIMANKFKRKNTTIAIEEVKQGLVEFSNLTKS